MRHLRDAGGISGPPRIVKWKIKKKISAHFESCKRPTNYVEITWFFKPRNAPKPHFSELRPPDSTEWAYSVSPYLQLVGRGLTAPSQEPYPILALGHSGLVGTSAFRTTFHIAAWLHPQSLTEMTPLEWCPKDFVVTMPRVTKNSKILNSRRNHDHNYLLPQIIATLFRNIFPSRCLLHCTFYVF